ncbi:MAG: pitrilysin family protein [Candidatus Kaiserbacteria bacterium]|nr:pitrilysin family protein [Candidatus Kaiserbacteria bacterium]
MNLSLHKLENGIPVLLNLDEQAETVCVLVGVGVGSNHEADNEHGLAHFFEHMCFKGTETFPNQKALLTHLDGLGVVSNAFTSNEYTAYYTHGRSERCSDMLQVTADIFLHSLFAEEEVAKEKGVVLEEIAMYEDDPSEKSHESVELSLFAGTAAGHPVIGTVPSVQSFSRSQFVSFFEKHYTTGNMIISIAGKFDPEQVLSELNRLYTKAPAGKKADPIILTPSGPAASHRSIVRSDMEQMRVAIGGYAPSMQSSDRFAATVFTTLFGGSMSSRLFLRIREEMGACYDIGSYNHMQSSAGLHGISTGIPPARVAEVSGAIAEECSKVCADAVSDEELRRAKDQVLGRFAVARESVGQRATRQALLYLQTGGGEDEHTFVQHIEAVTADAVQQVARDIYTPQKMAICYIGKDEVQEEVSDAFFKTLV